MKILVGIKRVVDYNVRVRVLPDGSGVDTDGVKIGSPEYILRGIWGGFQGLLLWEPYRRTVLRYSDEGRSVSRLRLRLTDAEKVRLLERLDDLRQSRVCKAFDIFRLYRDRTAYGL